VTSEKLQLQGGLLNVADDSCRVLLRGSSSDYINASHVEYVVRDANVDVTRCCYIATQVLYNVASLFTNEKSELVQSFVV